MHPWCAHQNNSTKQLQLNNRYGQIKCKYWQDRISRFVEATMFWKLAEDATECFANLWSVVYRIKTHLADNSFYDQGMFNWIAGSKDGVFVKLVQDETKRFQNLCSRWMIQYLHCVSRVSGIYCVSKSNMEMIWRVSLQNPISSLSIWDIFD